ncbi:MAG: hypothetical protein IPM57_01060 [Oligoflexia bacterium]|nr:hypothetical protein [Oligoflexia bacterium]
MSVIRDRKEHPGQKAKEANPYKDGPHDARVKSRVSKQKQTETKEAAYVVSVEAKPKDETQKSKLLYTPEEVRAKAKAFLHSSHLTPEERSVLAEILADKKDS